MHDVRQYYQYNNNCYICPTCLIVHKRFDSFTVAHFNHGQFTQSKSDTLKLCTSAEEGLDGEEEEEEDEEGPFYIWCNMEDARQYYKHHKQFLCPVCETYSVTFDEFVENHQQHARAFIRPKSTFTRPAKPINTSGISQQQQQQQQRPAMKRQYGGAMERIRLSHHTALRNCHITIEATLLDDDEDSVRNFVREHRDRLMLEFHQRLENNVEYKVQMTLLCNYHRVIKKAEEEEEDREEEKTWYVSNAAVPFVRTSEFMNDGARRLDEKMANYSSHGSNWTIQRIIKVGFIFTRHDDMCRIAGQSYIPLPASLDGPKKGLVNPQNKHDNMCFVYAILAVAKYDMIRDGNRHRVSNYTEFLNELVYNEDSMPMRIAAIPKFERQNPQYRINVMRYTAVGEDSDDNEDKEAEEEDEKEVYSNPHVALIYRSRNNDMNAQVINLLLLESEKTFHYVGVVNLNNLLNTHKGHKRIQSRWCTNCLHGFGLQSALDKHRVLCESSKVGATACVMPDKVELKFSDLHKTVSPAYVVYADFESLLVPQVDDEKRPQIHLPAAAAYLMISATSVDIQSPAPTVYKDFYGPNCIVDFLTSLEEQAKVVYDWYREFGDIEMLPLTDVELSDFTSSTHCYLCNNKFNNDKVKDHDHFTGHFVGAACNECNLARRHSSKMPFLPIVFHNLRGYDMHHIVRHAIDKFPAWNLTCIPQSSEKFLSLTAYIKGRASLRFIDSYQFLNAPLSRLVTNLDKDNDLLLTNNLSNLPDYVRNSKGIFPYSFAKTFNELEQAADSLPSIDAFYDVLTERVTVTQQDHEVACRIWRDVGCRNLKDYMMTYLKLDVFLLADVFEAFRYTVINEDNGLDLLHFYSIPGLSWSSALKSMNRPLQLLDDPTMYQFFESGIRGGMTFVNKHHVTANERTSMLYIDINNLYGWALSRKLPCSDFTWIVDDDQLLYDLVHVKLPFMDVAQCDVGYLFEVDLHTPHHLHDKLDQLPPAPITQPPPGSKVCKLLLTHEDKSHYLVHFALLQHYMSPPSSKTMCSESLLRATRANVPPLQVKSLAHSISSRTTVSTVRPLRTFANVLICVYATRTKSWLHIQARRHSNAQSPSPTTWCWPRCVKTRFV